MRGALKLQSCPSCSASIPFTMSALECPSCHLKLERESPSRAVTAPFIGAVVAGVLSLLPLWVAIPVMVFLVAWLMWWTLKLRVVAS